MKRFIDEFYKKITLVVICKGKIITLRRTILKYYKWIFLTEYMNLLADR